MATTTITITHNRESDYKGRTYDSPRLVCEKLAAFLSSLGGGVYQGTSVSVGQDAASASITLSGVGGTASTGTLTFSSASGTTTATVNGVAFSQTTGTDAQRATQLAGQINASTDPAVSGVVTASAALGVVTVTAVEKGGDGDLNTLAVSGTGLARSGANLSGGVDGLVDLAVTPGTVNVATTNLTDTAAAAAIVAAINEDSTITAVLTASSSGAVLTLTAVAAGADGNQFSYVANTNTGTTLPGSGNFTGGASTTYTL